MTIWDTLGGRWWWWWRVPRQGPAAPGTRMLQAPLNQVSLLNQLQMQDIRLDLARVFSEDVNRGGGEDPALWKCWNSLFHATMKYEFIFRLKFYMSPKITSGQQTTSSTSLQISKHFKSSNDQTRASHAIQNLPRQSGNFSDYPLIFYCFP